MASAVQRPTRTMAVAVLDVRGEHDLEMATSEHQEAVQAPAPERADEALGDRVRAWGANRCLEHPDGLAAEDGVEGLAEPCVAVPDKKPGDGRPFSEIRAEVPRLLGDPLTGGLGGHASGPYEARVVLDEEEHVEPLEQDGVDAKEVAGDQDFCLMRRNSAQLGPDRRGAGSMPWRFKIAQTVDGAMVTPGADSPWMRR